MNSRYINIFRTVFACCDLLTINGVYLILVSNMHRIPGGAGDKYQVLYAVANMLWLIAAYVSGLYTANNHPSWEDLARKTLRCLLAFYGSIALFMFLYHFTFSRLFVVCWLAAFGLIVFGVRVILLLVASYLSRSGHIAKRVVIVGYNDVAVQLAEMFSQQDRSLQVEGYFEDSHRVHELSRFPIIGDINECLSYAINNNVNEIYSTISPEQDRSIYEMAHVAERSLIRFKFVPDLKLYVNRNTHMEYMGQLPVLSL
ncbi:MAG TPA: hypothetical protein VI233_02210, partial [Puia sp.]